MGSGVTDMQYMFYDVSFNQDLSEWDTSSVMDMTAMFYMATSFNQDLSKWDTSHVTSMRDMFRWANSFGVCLIWDISNAHTTDMFAGSYGNICTAPPSERPTLTPSSIPNFQPSNAPSLSPSKPSLLQLAGIKQLPTLKSLIIPMILCVCVLSLVLWMAFYYSRKHAAEDAAAQSISSSEESQIYEDLNIDTDLFRLSNNMKVTHCKKSKPNEIVGPTVTSAGENQIMEVEAVEVTTDLFCPSEVCALLEACAPEGYRPLRNLLLASSRTISEEILVSRISDSYLGYVEDGVEGSELAENVMKDYLVLRD